MGLVTLPNNLANGNPADASQVMANYNAIDNVVNGGIDDANVSASNPIQPSKILGTALTQAFYKTFSQHNIVYNPFLFGSGSTVVFNWNINTNAALTLNDSTVTSGVNSVADANASDTWVINQTLGTSLNTSSTQSDVLLQPGKLYCVWAQVKTTAGAGVVKLTVQNASSFAGANPDISTTVVTHTGDGTYQKLYNIFTVPASCQNITIALLKAGTTTSVAVSEIGMCLGSLPAATENNAHLLASGKTYTELPITSLFKMEAYIASNQTIATGGALSGFDTKVSDPNTNFNTTTHLYICPIAGDYLVIGNLSWIAFSGQKVAILNKNGTGVYQVANPTTDASNGTQMPFMWRVTCALGDTLSIQAFQSSGGNQTLQAGSSASGSRLQISYINS